jgi:hypothetical protein
MCSVIAPRSACMILTWINFSPTCFGSAKHMFECLGKTYIRVLRQNVQIKLSFACALKKLEFCERLWAVQTSSSRRRGSIEMLGDKLSMHRAALRWIPACAGSFCLQNLDEARKIANQNHAVLKKHSFDVDQDASRVIDAN